MLPIAMVCVGGAHQSAACASVFTSSTQSISPIGLQITVQIVESQFADCASYCVYRTPVLDASRAGSVYCYCSNASSATVSHPALFASRKR